MKKNSSYLINIALLAAIFFLTYRLMFADTEFSEILADMKTASPGWLAVGVVTALLFGSCEGIVIRYMLHVMKQKTSTLSCLKYSFIGFFFSYITPSSTGGQPAQMYYMKKDGIKIGYSAIIMLLITIAYKAALLVMGLLCLILRHDAVRAFPESIYWMLVLGYVLSIGLIVILYLLLRKPVWVRDKGYKGIRFLVRKKLMREKTAERSEAKLTRICDNYQVGAAYIKKNPRSVAMVFLITAAERMFLTMITWVIYKAFGLSGTGFWDIFTLQVLLTIAVEMLPLPGAAGVTEVSFLLIFTGIFTESLVKPALLITRGLSFYLVLIVGALCTFYAHFMNMRRSRQRGEVYKPPHEDTEGDDDTHIDIETGS